ncbi:MAG: bifunctional serine/threonine-protein kinase/ABC transporter substrate-binding protein [Firmicutes bacterium]|nr:bifunctional serine/threonine-protein kinase/ABC transporter substrate-binding protein [Bacillota bacterium]
MLKRGDILKNRYTVKQVLSSSVRSNVYLIEDSQLMKEWALKEYIIQVENPQEVTRATHKFEKEVTILAGLKHAGIPEVIDYFVIVDKAYLVMEYIKGKNLEEVLEGTFQPMYEPDVLKIGMQMAGILHFLHKQSPPIVFRDLCPANVIITGDNMVKFVDFSLGRHFKSIKDVNAKKIGTPGYAPPEQFGRDVYDERTDIYALGAILHQMLTLKNPAELSNIFKFAPIKEVNPKVSVPLEEIVGRATKYDSAERYSSALEMKREMENLLSKRGTSPSSDTASSASDRKSQGKWEADKTNVGFYTPPPAPKPSARKQDPKRESFDEEPVEKKAMPEGLKKLLVVISVLIVAFLGFGIYHKFFRQKNTKVNTVESPFSQVKDKHILQLREDAFKHYNQGVQTSDSSELALAISQLQKVSTAHPTDVVSQIYLENANILMQKKSMVKIPCLVSLTGENFESGMQILSGLAIVQNKHNSQSGKAKKIFLEVYDDQSKTEVCIKTASELANRKDILAVIGPNRSSFLATTASFFNNAKMVQISSSGTCPDVENLGEYIFRTAGDGRDLGVFMSKYALENLNLKKIAVVYDPTDSYSKVIGEMFFSEAKKMDKAELQVFNASLEANDYKSVLKEIKEFHPDGVFFVALHNHEAKFATQMKQTGIKATHLATVAAYSQQLVNEGGSAVEGIILNSYFFSGSENEKSREFTDAYRKKFNGTEPNFRAALAYDSLLPISAALNDGVYTTEELKNFLHEKLGNSVKIEGATGPITYNKNGIRNKMDLVVLTVKNGNFVLQP